MAEALQPGKRVRDHGEDVPAVEPLLRSCAETDSRDVLRVINTAALVYRGVIPADRWHEPYMRAEELRAEIAAGVRFTGYVVEERIVGVMGIQQVRNVRLIRHAYVSPEWQGHGVGSQLLEHLQRGGDNPILVGTWSTASWAVRFYERHGFALVPSHATASLLRTYWNVPERQIQTSVVLASPALSTHDATRLIANA